MLWALAYGLDETFLAAKDANNDKQADVNVAQLESRFDRIKNGGGAPGDYNWGIVNGLRVWPPANTTARTGPLPPPR